MVNHQLIKVGYFVNENIFGLTLKRPSLASIQSVFDRVISMCTTRLYAR